MTKMTTDDVYKVIENHRHWLYKDCYNWQYLKANLKSVDLSGINLHNVNLRDADLSGANLSGADLRWVILIGADLSGANLSGADLRWSNLSGANLNLANLNNTILSGTNLSNASLRDTDLSGANLTLANLQYTNLRWSNLSGADLTWADLIGADIYNTNLKDSKGPLMEYRKGKILTEDIIGYKKCKDGINGINGIIVTLKIPRGATVFSINGSKCRTNKVKVIDIDGSDRAISVYKYMSYYVGDEITVYDFNCQYNIECAEGIHFYMTRKEAECQD